MTVKVVELVGESDKSWEDAVQKAVADASKTIENIVGVEVLNNTATVENGKIVQYKSNIHVAFQVNDKR